MGLNLPTGVPRPGVGSKLLVFVRGQWVVGDVKELRSSDGLMFVDYGEGLKPLDFSQFGIQWNYLPVIQ